MNFLNEYNKWCNSDYFDDKTKAELLKIKDNQKEIEERFYKNLEFGTGGLRGILGAGSNRMNIYTVRKATQGLANFINSQNVKDREGVVIAYDSRRMSPEFATESALVLNANNIKAYIFESLRPTPELSYAVRELKAVAGIVITASHNPAEYNGYKVYWEDGAQVTSPKDMQIIEEVNNVKSYEDVLIISKEEAISKGLYNIIGSDIDKKYIDELKKLVINKDIIKKEADNLTIVYTPLHGTGNLPVRNILEEIGFNNVNVVKEQELPDSNFSTVDYPNPEDINAYELAIKLGREKNADIILATDPDADRLGVLVKRDNKYFALNGNMIGELILEYILSQKKEKNILPKNGAIIETIVSTNMAKAIAKEYNVKLFNVLTGFKYIGEKIKEFETNQTYEYLFGFEESYGCLIGTHARDKDAVVATMMICEIGAYYKSKGMTLYDALLNIYEKYGYYKESLESITLKGKEGIEKIQYILKVLRNQPLKMVNNIAVKEFVDYLEDTDLPKSNVLYYTLEDDSWFCVRPSGTEPKIKFYFGVKDINNQAANKHLKMLSSDVMTIINNIIAQ